MHRNRAESSKSYTWNDIEPIQLVLEFRSGRLTRPPASGTMRGALAPWSRVLQERNSFKPDSWLCVVTLPFVLLLLDVWPLNRTTISNVIRALTPGRLSEAKDPRDDRVVVRQLIREKVPLIGIVQVGSQSTADRYSYLPLIGLLIITAWGVPEFVGPDHDHAYCLCR
jgi:hypothetical protein